MCDWEHFTSTTHHNHWAKPEFRETCANCTITRRSLNGSSRFRVSIELNGHESESENKMEKKKSSGMSPGSRKTGRLSKPGSKRPKNGFLRACVNPGLRRFNSYVCAFIMNGEYLLNPECKVRLQWTRVCMCTTSARPCVRIHRSSCTCKANWLQFATGID